MNITVYDCFCGMFAGLINYFISLIVTILSFVDLIKPINIALNVIFILSVIAITFLGMINKQASLLQMIVRFYVMMVSYFGIMGINGSIGTVRYIYKLLNISADANVSSGSIVTLIIIIVGIGTIIFVSIGKLVSRLFDL